MPYEFNTPVAVITIESNDYPRPKLVNGQWVVSASSVRKEPNKIILYNPITRIMTPVTPYTVSLDYYKQVKEYEDTLAKIQAEQDEMRRLYADTTNPKQVNSFADVITAGDERFAQQLDRMFATGQPANIFSWIGDKGKALGELLKNMLIDPIMKKDMPFLGKEGKAAMLFNNALVNLSETMDYFTLTSVVKAYLINAVEGKLPSEIYKDVRGVFGDVYGSGRRQLDWNVQTSSAIVNTIANTILEVFSDPTTWISLGTSSAIKSAAKPQVSFVIQKSFDDVGIAVTKNQADNIAKGVIRSFIHGDNSLAEAVSKVHIGKGLKKQATSIQLEMFYYSLKKNAALLTEIPNMHLLKSVRGASEGIQKLASKTVGYTSALGWGYHAIKGALKGGLEVLPYAISKINSAIKKVDFDNITLKNLPEHLSIVEEELNILRDVVDLADRFPQQTVAQATHAFQEMKYIELKDIISKVKNTPSAKVLSELNAWAVKAGFIDILDVMKNLLRVKSAVPSDLRKMVYEIGNALTQLFDDAITETINPVVAVLNKDVLSKMVPTEYVGIIEQLSELKKLGITDTVFANTLYDDSIVALQSMLALFEHSEQRGINAYIQQYEMLKEFNEFTFDPKLTYKDTKFDKRIGRYVTVDVPVLDLDIATADSLKDALKSLKDIQSVKIVGDLASLLNENITKVWKLLDAWDKDAVSISMVQQANKALAFIKHALQEYNKYALDNTPARINMAIANTYMPAIDVLHHNLVEFIEKITRASRTPINEAFLFTDTIVGKAADSTAGHVVLEGLHRLAKDKGLPSEYVEKMYTQLMNYDLNVKLDADLPAVKNAFDHLVLVTEYLQDMDTGSYFIRELGLEDVIDDWADNGFTIGFGEDLLAKLDDAVHHIKERPREGVDWGKQYTVPYTRKLEIYKYLLKKYPNNSHFKKAYKKYKKIVDSGMANPLRWMDDPVEIISNIQLLRDEIQELVDIGSQTIDQRVKMTQELMSSNLYRVKLSHIQALSMLLNTEYVQEVLTNIRYGTNIGQLFDALADPSLSSDLAEAVGHIQSLSKSVYVANQIIKRIRDSNLPDVWKDGLYDTLAGYARMHIDELGSSEHVAYSWLTKAKTFIDNINHAHAPRFNELNHTGDSLDAAEYLYKIIFAPLSIEPPFGRVAFIAEYWEGIKEELLKDGNNYFNVVYSAGQTGFKSGTIYECSFVFPNGDSIKYVDKSMRDFVLQTIDNRTARKLCGKSKGDVLYDMQNIIRREANNPNVKVFDTTEEFAKALFDLFRGIKSTARDNKLIPRLIGFNTAVDSFGTDQLLSRFMNYNRLNTHIQYSDVEFKNLFSIKTFDAAQFLRVKYEGAVTITNDMLAEVTEIVRDAKVYLEEANAYTEYAKGYLIPDFNTTVKVAFREVLAALDNTIEILEYQSKRPRALSPDDFQSVTQEQFNLLTTAFSLNQLHGFRTELSNVIQNISATLLNIKQSNSVLGQFILIQEAIAKYTGERNVMNILNKYFVQPGGVPALSYKKVYYPDVFTEWFGTSNLNVEDLYGFTKMQDIADKLQRTKNKIKHPLLLTELDNAQMKQTIEVLKSQFIMLPNYRYSAWAKEVMMLEPGDNPINNYVIAKYLWDNIEKASDVNTLEAVSEAIKREVPGSARLLYYIQFPDKTVMFNEPLYIAGIDVLHSELIKDSNYIMQLTQEIQEITNVRERAETLYDALFLVQRIREERGLDLSSLRVKEQFVKAYTNFINSVQAEFDKAFAEYIDSLPELADSLERLEASKMYTAKVEKVISELDELSSNIAQRRANFIMTLTPDSYAKFLYKFSQSVQMFDMGAEIFRDTPELLGTFMHILKDGEQFGIKYVEDIKNKWMFVYLDKNIVDLEKMIETTKDFVLDTPKLSDSLSGSALQQAYYEFADMMDELFDGAYSLSMHRTMNNTRFKELLDYLPATVKDNMIPLEHLSENNLIEDLFSQTIVGDYSSGINTVFSVYSDNIVTNTAAGFNVAFNRMRGKDLYASLIFNQEHSLKAWVEGVSRLRKVEQDEVVDAITKNNYIVTELKDGKVKAIDIRKPSEYERALKEGAALLDYHTHMRSVEVINTVHYNSKLSKMIIKYLGAIKIGQLMSFGWLLRNIPDSAIKGWVQAGLDPMYVVSGFTRTRKIIAQYNATYAAVFKATNGNLSPKNVAEFFAKNTDELLLDEGLFKKLLTFYSNSASVPTAAQLVLDRDLVTKLYNKVKGNDSITRGHVKRALEIFKETAHTDSPFKNAYDSLRNIYSDDIATTLILLRKYVPKKELKKARVQPLVDKLFTSNYIMRANNSIESFIRTHTFLYHSVYNDGSIADALKAVDLSQFNRSRDSKAVRMMEHLLPFSTFQMDNFLFWGEAVKQGRGNLISLSEDILNGMYDEEQLDVEELSRNMSLQYLYMSGNLILDDETGMSLKINDSLHSVLELITSPVKTISDMLNVPLDVMRTLVQAILADEEAYAESPFGKVKPISQWEKEDYTDEMIQLIPLVGVIYQRYTTAWDRYQMSDMILPLIFPSIFGVTKLDSAGTTYHSRPIGFDWYNQTQEYKDTHRYVFGVSYVPSWMTKDPQTYANTFVRLQNMGYPKEVALEMMQRGWYMKAPNYQLKRHIPYIKYPKRTYTIRPQYVDRTYAKPTHYKYVKNVKKPKTFIMKSSKPYTLSPDRFKFTERNHVVRRVYRPKLYNDRYTRTGVARETLIKWRGPNRSSRQLLRDRSAASRRRIQRILRQIRPL